ncbi:putative YcfA family protein [Azospirillaceae bacterium]
MTPDELLRKLKRAFGGDVTVTQQGKGSHRTVYLRGHKTTLQKSGDFGPARVKAWLAQLGLKPEDLE